MSMTARHESKKAQHLCERCRDRKARFQHHGAVRADRDHTLCFACYRSERERLRAGALSNAKPSMLRSPFGPGRTLSEREIQHRRRMLAHCGRASQPPA
jgi:hypothetical protein